MGEFGERLYKCRRVAAASFTRFVSTSETTAHTAAAIEAISLEATAVPSRNVNINWVTAPTPVADILAFLLGTN